MFTTSFISKKFSQIALLSSSPCCTSYSIVCEMPSVTVELSWWQLQVLLTAAWLMTMYVSFQAGLRCQQFRMSFEEKLTVDEMKKNLPEVFMAEKGAVLHMSSTCTYLSKSDEKLMRWCSRCSWKKQKHQAKNE